jgi:HK97 family phage major capsid protein
MNFANDVLPPMSVGALVCCTKELLANSNPSIESILRSDLVRATREAIDDAFIDPDNAGIADVKPASVTHGVVPVDGATATIGADLAAMIEAFEGDLLTSAWVMSPRTAALLSGPAYPKLTALGGEMLGLPVLTSNAAEQEMIALIDGAGIAIADEGEPEIVSSAHATVDMADNPTNASVPPIPTALVSLFQANCLGIACDKAINFKVSRPGAVSVMTLA